MLVVMNLFALASFPTGEEVGVAAPANRPGLGAEHAAELHAAGSRGSLGHTHDPVDTPELVVAARAGLMEELKKRVRMGHKLPGAVLPVRGVHRRRIRQPGGTRSVAGHLHVMTAVLVIGGASLMLVLFGCRGMGRRLRRCGSPGNASNE